MKESSVFEPSEVQANTLQTRNSGKAGGQAKIKKSEATAVAVFVFVFGLIEVIMELMTLSDVMIFAGIIAVFDLLISLKTRLQKSLPIDKALILNENFVTRLIHSARTQGTIALVIFVALLAYSAQDNFRHNCFILFDYAALTLLYSSILVLTVYLYRAFYICIPQGILVQLNNPSLFGFLTPQNAIDLHLNVKRGFSIKDTYKSAAKTITQLQAFDIEMNTPLPLDGLMPILLKQNRVNKLPLPSGHKCSLLKNLLLMWNRRKYINPQEETKRQSLLLTQVTRKWVIPKKG